MNLSIKNYRGIKTAEIAITKLTLVAGLNATGKSSFAQAAAALLTGNILPDDIKKNQCGLIINEGAPSGSMKLTGDNGSATMSFPECTSMADGDTPYSSNVAAGLIEVKQKPVQPAHMSPRERSEYLSELLGLLPGLADLIKALPEYTREYIDIAWNEIKINGWDLVWDRAKKRGAELKGQWKYATSGETYGKSKAESWEPEGYSDRPLDAIKTQLQELKKQHESAIGKQAINQTEKTHLEILASEYDDASKAHEKASAKSVKLLDERNALYKHTAPVKITKETEQECPYCKCSLTINDGKIVRAADISGSDVIASEKAHDEYYKAINKIEKSYERASKKSDETLNKLEECEVARDKLTIPVSDVDVELINEQISVLLIQRDAITQYNEARSIHEKILANEDIVKVLTPEGLRKKFLTKGIDDFCTRLNYLSEISGYKLIIINDDMTVLYNKRPNSICSDSERFRRDVMIQLVCAKIDNSQVVIIDGADILDTDGLNGLIRAINYISIPAIVCMTIKKREDMPDMSIIGGRSYWIEDGIIHEEK